MATHVQQLLPQTQSVGDTLAFARQYLDEPTYNHVMRSSLFSCIINRNLKASTGECPLANADLEIVVVSNLLHDMAWNPDLATTKQFISKDKRFEVDSANTAREFLQKLDLVNGWNQRRIQLVWDAIALHTTPSIASNKEPEVALSQYGIAVDVYAKSGVAFPGVTAEHSVSQHDLDNIYKAFPSLKLAEYLKHAMCALCSQKPQTTWDNFASGFGEEYIEGYSLQGKRLVDFLKMRENEERGD